MSPDNKAAPAANGGEGKKRADSETVYPANPSDTTKRPDRPEWLAAKESGDAGEEIVSKVLRTIGVAIDRNTSPGDADLAISGKIEVKCDRQAEATGNVAVEVSYRGKPSGVMLDHADTWVYVIGGTLYIISREALRGLANCWRRTERPCGERARCVLIPLKVVRAAALVIDWREGGVG